MKPVGSIAKIVRQLFQLPAKRFDRLLEGGAAAKPVLQCHHFVHQHRHALVEVVMKLAGHSPAFLLLRREETACERLQCSSLARKAFSVSRRLVISMSAPNILTGLPPGRATPCPCQ